MSSPVRSRSGASAERNSAALPLLSQDELGAQRVGKIGVGHPDAHPANATHATPAIAIFIMRRPTEPHCITLVMAVTSCESKSTSFHGLHVVDASWFARSD